jgi:hypothetical protein
LAIGETTDAGFILVILLMNAVVASFALLAHIKMGEM